MKSCTTKPDARLSAHLHRVKEPYLKGLTSSTMSDSWGHNLEYRADDVELKSSSLEPRLPEHTAQVLLIIISCLGDGRTSSQSIEAAGVAVSMMVFLASSLSQNAYGSEERCNPAPLGHNPTSVCY